MEKSKALKYIGIAISCFAALVWAVAIFGPADSVKLLDAEASQQAIAGYYSKVMTLKSSLDATYTTAKDKVAKGDDQGVYKDFKLKAEPLFKKAAVEFFDLEREAPNVEDKKLLSDIAYNLGVYASLRHEAIKLFLEGVEESKDSKFLEAQAKNEKADSYLIMAISLLSQLESKFSLN